ncbi:MAG: hypothetical protein HC796_00645 [Synechococcaceae cyanobacterium RL_1_2]|nr:hypothetical protein [Synechococcaceae cyanobacterium RL_1_2]
MGINFRCIGLTVLGWVALPSAITIGQPLGQWQVEPLNQSPGFKRLEPSLGLKKL